ncbi:DUF1697 domain-containing protein [Solihabitans fulvus]|uniref:DUF1697 domain-containing protein n=1 Tax=Solihabitans fulvus TaxID=1892852 RepID=A0A5B2WVP7_9PSEU|nr:DUF1697 domain-containing protein [Solihabitans fulvus]KAA2254506.1 DUF1697 domain-containing protein [Solihabitans fulvus]
MATLAAFLRGINVSGRNKIPMPRLRELVTGLGYGSVRTHLQTGNVVFDAGRTSPADAERAIEECLLKELDLDVPVLARTPEELAAIAAADPFGERANDPARYVVNFLSAAPDLELLGQLDPARFAPDEFAPGVREIYVWCPNGIGRTKLLHSLWEKRLGVTATARNWNTLTAMLDLTAE